MRYYAGMRPGLMQGLQALAAGGGDAYNDEFTRLATVDSQRANARKSNASAALDEDRLYAASQMLDVLRRQGGTEGANAELLATAFRGSANPSVGDLTGGIGDLQTQSMRDQARIAAGAGDTGLMNRLSAIAAGEQYQPWELNETGRLNAETGQTDFTPGHRALAAQRLASGEESLAHAGLYGAQAAAAPYVANSGTLFDTRGGGRVAARGKPLDVQGGMLVDQDAGTAEPATLAAARQLAGRGMGLTDPQASGIEQYLQTGMMPEDPQGQEQSTRWQRGNAVPSVAARSQPAAGVVEPGNIDLARRPVVRNPDGSISTVRSIGVEMDGRTYLIPTVSDDGRMLTNAQAVDLFRRGGRHLGAFSSQQAADQYAQRLHEEQARHYAGAQPPSPEVLQQYQAATMQALQQLGADGGGDANEPSGALNAQLDEYFLEPATDKNGRPVFDPLTRKPALVPNQQRKGQFLAWWAANRARYPDINVALPEWVREQGGAGAAPAGAANDPLGIR